MTRLYKRGARLLVAKPTAFFTQEPNALVIRDLRMTFSIEKHLGAEPNTSTIEVYNLSEESRSFVQQKPRYIRLEAGYDDELQLIFAGDLVWGKSSLVQVDWVTTLQLGDGHRAFNYARVNRAFRGGVTGKTLLNEIAGSMGLRPPGNIEQATELAQQFAAGVSLQGPAHREMTRLLEPRGMSWSVQDGQLQILRPAEVRADQAILISEDTGMVGTPEQGPPDKSSGKPPTTTVRMLLKPRAVPGVKLRIESRAIRGIFRAERVTHRGDTFGNFHTEVEAIPL